MIAAHAIPQAQARQLVSNLTAIGDKLEAAGNPEWIDIAKAAATLESLRLGVLTVEPFPGGITS